MRLSFSDLLSIFVPHYILSAVITTFFVFFLSSGSVVEQNLIFGIILYATCIVAFNAYNMVFDEDIDSINKPLRPIPSKKISKGKILSLSISLFLLSIFLAILVNWQLSILFFAFFIEAIIYSTPPLRLRKILFFHNLNATLIFGLIPIFISRIVTGLILPLEFSFYLISLIFVTATVKDYEDISGEKKFKIKTIPNYFGIDISNKFILFGYFFLHFFMALFFIFIKFSSGLLFAAICGIIFSLTIYSKLVNFENSTETKIHSPLVNFVLFFTYLVQLIFIIVPR
ncbi:MAG: UbiA family prenyltransferase [Candidatus Diapherotrites archaeon]